MNKYCLLVFLTLISISDTFIHFPKYNINQLKNKIICSALSISNNTNTQSYLEQISTPKKETQLIRKNILSNIQKSENNIKRLQNVQNNIDRYIQDKNRTLEKGFISTYRPIPKATFDTIFLNIFQIDKVYISSNKDRMIFEFSNTNRYVYYIKNKEDFLKMEQFLNVIPNKIKISIINDIEKTMDDPFGYLYCDPK